MGSDLMCKVEVTMRTLHMNLMDNWVNESELIEDVEWSVRNTLRLHVELKTKVKEVEAEECTHASDTENDDKDEGGREEGSGTEKDDESEKGNYFELDTEEEDKIRELKVKNNDGKMRALKEWMSDTKEFMKDHTGTEVNKPVR